MKSLMCVTTLLAACGQSMSQSRMSIFSNGISQGKVTQTEQVLLEHVLSDGASFGAVTSWWLGGPNDHVTLNFYVDNETVPSISVDSAAACGAAFGAPAAPVATYSSAFFGKGAASSGWSNNIPVPFSSSIRITYSSATTSEVWLWARGVENMPIDLGHGLPPLPPTARLSVQKNAGYYQPQTFIDIVSLPANTSGLVLSTALGISSGNQNVLEGCVYAWPQYGTDWSDSVLMATGTEDYFMSAYYFNDGPFAHELSGALTLDANGPDGANRVAAYRVHDGRDALVFSDGFRLTWRVGDQTDTATGLKCTCPPGKAGCTSAGNPQPSNVTTLAWVYTW